MKILVACEESQAVTKELEKNLDMRLIVAIYYVLRVVTRWHFQNDVFEIMKIEVVISKMAIKLMTEKNGR